MSNRNQNEKEPNRESSSQLNGGLSEDLKFNFASDNDHESPDHYVERLQNKYQTEIQRKSLQIAWEVFQLKEVAERAAEKVMGRLPFDAKIESFFPQRLNSDLEIIDSIPLYSRILPLTLSHEKLTELITLISITVAALTEYEKNPLVKTQLEEKKEDVAGPKIAERRMTVSEAIHWLYVMIQYYLSGVFFGMENIGRSIEVVFENSEFKQEKKSTIKKIIHQLKTLFDIEKKVLPGKVENVAFSMMMLFSIMNIPLDVIDELEKAAAVKLNEM